MEKTQEFLDFIKQLEGFSSKPYEDSGQLSGGYGHKLTANEIEVFKDAEISLEQAHLWLINDCQHARNIIDAVCKYSHHCFTDTEKWALISFCYNTGYSLQYMMDFAHACKLYYTNKTVFMQYQWCKLAQAQFTSPKVKMIPAIVYMFRCYIKTTTGIALLNLFNRRSAEANLYLNADFKILDRYSDYEYKNTL